MRARWLAITSARESPERGGILATLGGGRSGRRREPRERRMELVSCSAGIYRLSFHWKPRPNTNTSVHVCQDTHVVFMRRKVTPTPPPPRSSPSPPAPQPQR